MPPRRTLRFAGRVLRLLERAAPKSRLAECYGWLCDYRQALANWTSEQAAAEAAVAHVRRHELRCDTVAELDAVWSKLTLTPGGREVAARLRAATERESAQAQPGETRVGCTEVLESTFGTLKRLAGSYSGNGFTTLSSEPPCTNSAACSSKQPTPNQIQHEAHATPRQVQVGTSLGTPWIGEV